MLLGLRSVAVKDAVRLLVWYHVMAMCLVCQALTFAAPLLVCQCADYVRYRRLLAKEEDLAVLEQLPEHVRAVLSAFSRRKVPDDARKQATDAAWSLDSDALWTLRDRSYADWVCRLSVALLLRVSSAKLAACRSVAARKPALAELLLPHALADLAAHSADASLLRTLSAQVRLLYIAVNTCCTDQDLLDHGLHRITGQQCTLCPKRGLGSLLITKMRTAAAHRQSCTETLLRIGINPAGGQTCAAR